jgi:hypothetical protein
MKLSPIHAHSLFYPERQPAGNLEQADPRRGIETDQPAWSKRYRTRDPAHDLDMSTALLFLVTSPSFGLFGEIPLIYGNIAAKNLDIAG